MPFAAVVVNPTNVSHRRLRSVIEAAENRAGWDRSVWFETSAEDPGRAAARDALATSPDVVIVVGGDGTIRTVTERLHQSAAIPVTIVPTGTGNLLARNLHLSRTDLEHAVAAAFTGIDRAIDIVSVTLEHKSGTTSEHSFLAMAGIGLDATMAANSSSRLKAILGWPAYIPPIGRSIVSNRSFTVHPRVDSKYRKSVRAHTMIVGNCGVLTGNIVLMPAAAVDDALLDVVILRPGRLIGWTPIGLRLALNRAIYRRNQQPWRTPHGLPSTRTAHHAQGARFEATFDEPQLIELDGDPIAHVIKARFELQPGRMNLRVPSDD